MNAAIDLIQCIQAKQNNLANTNNYMSHNEFNVLYTCACICNYVGMYKVKISPYLIYKLSNTKHEHIYMLMMVIRQF